MPFTLALYRVLYKSTIVNEKRSPYPSHADGASLLAFDSGGAWDGFFC